ncbi:hypothetical protein [Candidatus Nitronereus thalassa]|uniref:Zinc-binding domain-containing protein n=1 Tax=Candidatus Nitronereus thalassa TaxID=3020898 RepID=A0ABU3K5P7_9BACT|nr:hypothetical protein [Candidatus Nitronereus thalassa]MDT7041691.1 hypothetical protein [Candidatus Nitronereus thalassa]
MGTRDRDWPGYTMWFCCPKCGRLWTYQGADVVALDPKFALGPARVSEGIAPQVCSVCEGTRNAPAAEI